MFNKTSRFVYLQSDLIVTHIPFSYISVHIYRHCIGLFILCTYVMNWGVSVSGPISHNNEQTQSVKV